MNQYRYALFTPAYNEADYIEHTLRSVVAQTIRPEKWVIVSDGSDDGTDGIVKAYAADHEFIELVRRERDESRNFGQKVYAIRAAEERLRDVDYDFIGNLDADISFEPDYFERLLEAFRDDETLGIAGGRVYDVVNGELKERMVSPSYSVAGAVQLFRRACYEQVGGYRPLRWGGIDSVADAYARMYGWKVRTLLDLTVAHYRVTGTAGGRSQLRAAYRTGTQEYVNGFHPVFVLAKSARRLLHRPVVMGAVCRVYGYVDAMARRREREVSEDLIRFLRREQMQRLRRMAGFRRAV